MNNNQVMQIIQGIGLMAETWTITYQSFKKQNMNDNEAIMHTKAFMSVMLESFFSNSSNTSGEDNKE